MKKTFPLLILLSMTVPNIVSPSDAGAAAPPRNGQPYAEARCSTDPNILVCEDFDYPQNFICAGATGSQGFNQTWINPGWSNGGPFGFQYCSSADFPNVTAAGLPTAPGVSGGVYRASMAKGAASASYDACILGDCDRSTNDMPMTYQNGSPATNDLYFRFQIYNSNSPDWYWPSPSYGLDNKVLFLYTNKYTSKTDANVDAGLYFNSSGRCNTGGGATYNDALSFRVGSNSGSFKWYPAHLSAGTHLEYCSGTGTPNGTNGDGTVPVASGYPPSGDPEPGTLFRMKTGRWYTVEFRYKLSNPGVKNGTIEAWVDGIKVYGDNDLETCGNYGANEGSCYALHEIFFEGSWFNPLYGDVAAAQSRGGYRLIDNFIISQSYIGPPSSSTDTTPPPAPTGVKVSKAVTVEPKSAESPTSNPQVRMDFELDPTKTYVLFKNGRHETNLKTMQYTDRVVDRGQVMHYELREYTDGAWTGVERIDVKI